MPGVAVGPNGSWWYAGGSLGWAQYESDAEQPSERVPGVPSKLGPHHGEGHHEAKTSLTQSHECEASLVFGIRVRPPRRLPRSSFAMGNETVFEERAR
jgi:hypothetical protein